MSIEHVLSSLDKMLNGTCTNHCVPFWFHWCENPNKTKQNAIKMLQIRHFYKYCKWIWLEGMSLEGKTMSSIPDQAISLFLSLYINIRCLLSESDFTHRYPIHSKQNKMKENKTTTKQNELK